MSVEPKREPRLQPRWFIRSFWAVQRAVYAVTRGRFGLRSATADRWGMMRLRTVGRRTGEERKAILGYFEDGPDLVTMAMNGWADPEPAWWLNLQAQPDVTVDLVDGHAPSTHAPRRRTSGPAYGPGGPSMTRISMGMPRSDRGRRRSSSWSHGPRCRLGATTRPDEAGPEGRLRSVDGHDRPEDPAVDGHHDLSGCPAGAATLEVVFGADGFDQDMSIRLATPRSCSLRLISRSRVRGSPARYSARAFRLPDFSTG